MKRYAHLVDENTYIGVHNHCFNNFNHVPSRFPNGFLKKASESEGGKEVLGLVLKNINPYSSYDKFDYTLKMIETGGHKTQREVLLPLLNDSPKNSLHVMLTMEMNYMGAGKSRHTLEQQMEELHQLREEFTQLLLFMCIDHRNPDMMRLFNKYVVDLDWDGVKMYPSTGTMPNSIKYYPIFAKCEELGKPIITHCTYSNAVHYQGGRKKLAELLGDKYDPKLSIKANCDKFTDPMNYEVIHKDFPNLLIDYAHLGGVDKLLAWYRDKNDKDNPVNKLRYLMRTYKGAYSDISYAATEKKIHPLITLFISESDLKEKILFGTDYPMSLQECTLLEWSVGIRHSLGENNWNQMQQNNRKFLGL